MIQEGWRCPICGHVYAPWVTECSRCGNNEGSINIVKYPIDPNKPIIVKDRADEDYPIFEVKYNYNDYLK